MTFVTLESYEVHGPDKMHREVKYVHKVINIGEMVSFTFMGPDVPDILVTPEPHGVKVVNKQTSERETLLDEKFEDLIMR